jgi:hypothetical protein
MRIAWLIPLILVGLAGCTVNNVPPQNPAPQATVVTPAPAATVVTPMPGAAVVTTP